MSGTVRLGLVAAVVLAATGLVLGCDTTIEGRPFVNGLGWTIVANANGTRITNDRTGHGMFVSVDEVSTY